MLMRPSDVLKPENVPSVGVSTRAPEGPSVKISDVSPGTNSRVAALSTPPAPSSPVKETR